MQFLAREHRHKVVEVAISADYADPAKRSPVMQGLGVIDGVMRLVGQTRPLLFMGVPGLFLLLLGLLIGLDVVAIYAASSRLAVGYALLSIMCIIIGAMTLFSGVILHSMRALLISMRLPTSIEAME